jgi:hypothetical protein
MRLERQTFGSALRRKPHLGRYSGSRQEWAEAYRMARLTYERYHFSFPPESWSELLWKAGLIVAYERRAVDPIIGAASRVLMFQRLMRQGSAPVVRDGWRIGQGGIVTH